MSAGNRSGVNWMRRKLASRLSARLRMARVLARPGMPSSNRFESHSRQRTMLRTTRSWPMIERDMRSSRARIWA
ncbi:hypothetical protein D3C78_1386520 [compost metagenome]